MKESLNPFHDIHRQYVIRMEIAMILSLILFILVFRMEIKPEPVETGPMASSQEIIHMEEIQQTKHQERTPPPPRPVVPFEVPNDAVLEDETIDFSSDLSFDDVLDLPPPPTPSEAEPDEEQVFTIVEQMPELIGGLRGLQSSIVYPDMAMKAGIEGRVIVQFVIDEQGRVLDPRVVRGIGGGCDEEALKAVTLARFKPGMQRGRPVKVRYNLPISFSLKTSS